LDSDHINLLLLNGDLGEAQAFVARRFPGCECRVIQKRELREAGWLGQMKALRRIEGKALVFFMQSLAELQEPQLTAWTGLFHRCQLTVLAETGGRTVEYGRLRWLWMLPGALASGICDLATFASAWFLLVLGRAQARPVEGNRRTNSDTELDLAYLYPYPADANAAGGALSHVQGFVSGVASLKGRCEIISGRALRAGGFPVHLVPRKRTWFLFRESMALSYNLRFAWKAWKLLRRRTVACVYQRHGRFVVAGALLSRMLRVPLILEYNASELRMADYGDPVRFRNWLNLCEQISLRSANSIVVVSEALRQELMEQGTSNQRIVVSPNAVNPEVFSPGPGGAECRKRLGIDPAEIVVAFVGTFSYWHGVRVLQRAIERLLTADNSVGSRLRFLLVGDGPLCAEIRMGLEKIRSNRVIFTGLVPHEFIPAYLDAADIMLSPHVRMPDGRPFFGSPTKLFEYMAMAKAIIASNLDQLAQVLIHRTSAWLVEPGDASELASAILLLAGDGDLRKRLGENARAAVLREHTWEQNAARVLNRTGRIAREPGSVAVVGAPS